MQSCPGGTLSELVSLGDHDTLEMMKDSYEKTPREEIILDEKAFIKPLQRIERLFTLRRIRPHISLSPALVQEYKSLLLPKPRPYRIQQGKDWLVD